MNEIVFIVPPFLARNRALRSRHLKEKSLWPIAGYR
jgi:hypothetical protein